MDAFLPFRDRAEAGRRLAAALSRFQGTHPLILAIPRGAVPMARIIADALDGELDVILVRKLGAPDNPEFAIGAIDERGELMLDAAAVEWSGADRDYLQREASRQLALIRERRSRYCGGRPGLALGGIPLRRTARPRARGPHRDRGGRWAGHRGHHARGAARGAGATSGASGLRGAGRCTREPGAGRPDCGRSGRAARAAGVRRGGALLPRIPRLGAQPVPEYTVHLHADGHVLDGDLRSPGTPKGLVVFAHGSGSSRHSARNRFVAEALNRRGFATLLFDLLTPQEDRDRAARFDIALLARRLEAALGWARDESAQRDLPIALFGASTGAAAALVVAARRPGDVDAVVSRGGRPDLAGKEALSRVRAPTLLLVGGADQEVLALNRAALALIGARAELILVPGATHLFEEPGALAQVATMSAEWLARVLSQSRHRGA